MKIDDDTTRILMGFFCFKELGLLQVCQDLMTDTVWIVRKVIFKDTAVHF